MTASARAFACLLSVLVLSVLDGGWRTAPALAEIKFGKTTFSGFGTLGLVHDNDEEVGFVRESNQHNRPENSLEWRPDTRLGLQLSHEIHSRLRMVGQVILKDDIEDDIDAMINRAFLDWRPLAGLSLRAGRIGDATFLMSEYRDVGYAYPWARPPETTYSPLSVFHYDGLEMAYAWLQGDTSWRLKGMTGKFHSSLPVRGVSEPFLLESEDLWGAALIREQGPLRLWLGGTTLRNANEVAITKRIRQEAAAFAQAPGNPYAAEAQALADELDWSGMRVIYGSLGLAYDDGRWLGQAELGRLYTAKHTLANGDLAYLGLGRRFAEFLPYVLVGAFHGGDVVTARNDWSTLGQPYGFLQRNALISATATLID